MTPTEWLFVVMTAPTALGWIVALVATLVMVRRLPVLANVEPTAKSARVTLVTPACNEVDGVVASLESWLAQGGDEIDIVAVDDRSDDGTGEALDALAARAPRVQVVHVTELPDGWLGKVHALEQGTKKATGDWLLFADADVQLAEGALARAVAHAEEGGFDLVSAYPEIASAGFVGDAVWNAIGATTGPSGLWRSRDPKSERAFAVGAFILVRREAFEVTPGFSWIKLEVADDQGLAILLKHHGFRCDLVSGRGLVKLVWYRDFAEMVQKTHKNWFGIMGRFSTARCFVLALLIVAMAASPLWALLPGVRPALLGFMAVGQAAFFLATLIHARWARRPLLPCVAAPLGLLLIAGMLVRSGRLGARLGGITWRGVVYRSDLLRDVQRFQM